MRISAIAKQLRRICGPEAVLDRPEDLLLYEYDGGLARSRPNVVVFPQTTEQVAAIVRLANDAKVPIVPRGAGTGLSGGAIPQKGGIRSEERRVGKEWRGQRCEECWKR